MTYTLKTYYHIRIAGTLKGDDPTRISFDCAVLANNADDATALAREYAAHERPSLDLATAIYDVFNLNIVTDLAEVTEDGGIGCPSKD